MNEIVLNLVNVNEDPANTLRYVVAYRYASETTWRDPHGGEWSEEDQEAFTSVARGTSGPMVDIGEGKWRRPFELRLVIPKL